MELRDAVMKAHAALVEMQKETGGKPATTLTMYAAFWPRAFIVHVGDSRMYRYRDGELTRFTSDQTYEQLMLESGAIKPGRPEAARLKHVLWSAVGNDEVVPQIVYTDITRRDVLARLQRRPDETRHRRRDRSALGRDESAEENCPRAGRPRARARRYGQRHRRRREDPPEDDAERQRSDSGTTLRPSRSTLNAQR